MTSKAPSGRPSSGGSVPPTTRRSARQQRLASREANRSLARAGTRGSGGSGGQLMKYTLAALVVAGLVIAGAFLLTAYQTKNTQTLHDPNPPAARVITPASIPANGRTLGNANAPHTLDLYEDFQCPICSDFTRDSEPQMLIDYVKTGQVKIVYHDYLVIDGKTPGSTESLDAANAALCANDQGQFWLMHDWLFANQYGENSSAYTKDRLKAIGKAAGIKDLNKFNSCVDGGNHNDEIKTATIPSGVTGTPTLIMDGKVLSLNATDYATVSALLNTALGISPSPSVSASPSASPTASPSAAPSK
jgi:protein-disulfide isomerase